ncbi:MAG TPA: electron transfer flavoprotein subunit alpha/FixB family protein [Bacteroidota bacterium]|nr:electron transfer flavoprotein subunit alpha/FixB family protein [Bacteroidota bacterium]
MKLLLVCEYRQGRLLDGAYELLGFADRLNAERAVVTIAADVSVPKCNATVYLADAERVGEYNPDAHKRIILAAAEREQPDAIVFSHTVYGWDMAPRIASSLKAALISEVVASTEGRFEVPCFNSKMRRIITPNTPRIVLTIQAGAFAPATVEGSPRIERVESESASGRAELAGYEPAPMKDIDLGRAEVIVSVGRGVGKKENIPVVAALARELGGELGATRPVVDAGWLEYSHQVGSTGQIVAPKLYVACGISGAIQHLAGMKRSDFILAINKDKDAPIASIADVLVVADVMQFVPALTSRLQQ